jgi:hypothetical protein
MHSSQMVVSSAPTNNRSALPGSWQKVARRHAGHAGVATAVVIRATGGKQIAEAFKGGIREHRHGARLLLAEGMAKSSLLNVR